VGMGGGVWIGVVPGPRPGPAATSPAAAATATSAVATNARKAAVMGEAGLKS